MTRVESHNNSVSYIYNGATVQAETLYAVNTGHVRDLLVQATKLAIKSAYECRVDMPVGAATGQGGRLLAADYAKDNLLNDPRAHAEYMAIKKTSDLHPHAQPDSIGVTLEPCTSCQEYISKTSSIKLVAYALPTIEASTRSLVRHKKETILHRLEQGKLPYDIILVEDPQLQEVGRILLDCTRRNIDTQEISIDILKLDKRLPRAFKP